jgi:hypothetical protein
MTDNWFSSPPPGLSGCAVPDGHRGSDSVDTEPFPLAQILQGCGGTKDMLVALAISCTVGTNRASLGVARSHTAGLCPTSSWVGRPSGLWCLGLPA